MRLFRLASYVALLAALPLFAREGPTLSSISPSSLHEASGDGVMTHEGTNFPPPRPWGGGVGLFAGRAGPIALPPNAGTDTEMFVWLPLEVINIPGNYTVT